MGSLLKLRPKSKKALPSFELLFDQHCEKATTKEALSAVLDCANFERKGSYPHLFAGLGLNQKQADVLEKCKACLESIEQHLGLNIVDENGAPLYSPAIVTSSGAEAICHVHHSIYFNEMRETGKNHALILSSAPAPFHSALTDLEPLGVIIQKIESTLDGVDLKNFESKLSPRTALVSIPLHDALLGSSEPIEKIAQMCHARHIALHIDISSSLGRSYIDLEVIDPDYITMCAKALGAPFPSGLLFKKKEASLSPFIKGDPSQNGMRAGGMSLPILKSIETAVQHAQSSFHEVSMEIAHLKAQLKQKLAKNKRILFFEGSRERLPDVLCFGLKEIKGELFAHALSLEGIYVSIGGHSQPSLSQLLESKGVDSIEAQTAISIRLPHGLKESELSWAVERILEVAQKLESLDAPLQKEI
jgi:cysteine desulfurase